MDSKDYQTIGLPEVDNGSQVLSKKAKGGNDKPIKPGTEMLTNLAVEHIFSGKLWIGVTVGFALGTIAGMWMLYQLALKWIDNPYSRIDHAPSSELQSVAPADKNDPSINKFRKNNKTPNRNNDDSSESNPEPSD